MTARTPEQDPPSGAGLPAGDEPAAPAGSRRIRRRLAFPWAQAPGTPAPTGTAARRKRGEKGPSPWQRADEAWSAAGLHWRNVPFTIADPGEPVEGEGGPGATEAPGALDPGDGAGRAVDSAERAVGVRRPSHTVVAVAAVVLVGVGVGAYARAGGEAEDGPRSAVAAAEPAEDLFTADPAAGTDGLAQNVATVAASGSMVVAAGTETAGDGTPGRDRARFLVSANGGRSWRLAPVHAPDGEEPAPGAGPRMLAGGAGAWVALGPTSRPGEVAVWTSADAERWTRESGAGPPFGPRDRVAALARTSGGFVAVGTTSPSGSFAEDARGVVWTSAEGREWQRTGDLAPLGIAGLGALAASGDNLVAHGTQVRTVTENVKREGKKPRKVTRTVRGEGMWRSGDAGRTWAPIRVRHAQGSYGPVKGLTAGPGGFFAVREGKGATGSGSKRRTARHGVVFGSADGAAWAPTGRLAVPGYESVERFAGTSTGLAALVRGKGAAGTVLHSADGRSWRPGGRIGAPGPGSALSGLAPVGAGAAVLGGHRGADGYLAVAGPSAGSTVTVDLTAVPDAVRTERALTALATGRGGRLLAVGSAAGSAAAWTMDGNGRWARARTPAAGARLNAAVHGPQGWLAVGRAGTPEAPLVVTSQDGRAWSRTGLPGARTVAGVAAGKGGYVAVGMAGGSAGAWRSADLKAWTRGAGAGKADLAGPAWMRDVASTGTGYAAVGGRRGAGPAAAVPDRPAVWTSPDGLKWTAAAPPALPSGLASGAFFQVVARGGALLALGWGRTTAAPGPSSGTRAFYAHSADGGRTWRTAMPAGADEPVALTAATTTPKGFLIAGTEGADGRRDVVLWTSPDGAAWRRVPSSGPGLDGHGDQRLTALAAVGNEVVGTGFSGGHRGEVPMLWRTAAP